MKRAHSTIECFAFGIRDLFVPVLPLLALLAAAIATAAPRPDLVQKVKNGEIREARASWWGFDAADSTQYLQAAIDSGVPKLIVDDVGKPWITRPLVARSNQEIEFEKGVVLEAKRGEFKGLGDSLLTIRDQHDVTLRGYGAVLRMHREDYDNPKLYKKGEWRMVLKILSSRNIRVYGLTLALSGGDGIYLGTSKSGKTNENIHIKDVICDRNYRQGISVISARNLLIENTIMRDTAGTPPMAGIDFEPNHPEEELVNCVLRNCVSENNSGCGYAIYIPTLHGDSAPATIRLENCISRNNSGDLWLTTGNTKALAVTGSLDVVKCRFERSRGTSISIRNKPLGGMKVRFVDCVVDTPAVEKADLPPISITSRPGARRPIGDIDFGRLVVIDPVQRPVLDFYDWLGAVGAESITGTLVVRRKDKEEVIRLTREWWDKQFPERPRRNIPALSTSGVRLEPLSPPPAPGNKASRGLFYLRGIGRFILYARKGQPVRITFSHQQVGRYAGKPAVPVVTGPDGKNIRLSPVPFKSRTETSFTAWADGPYRIKVSAGANRIGVVDSTPPLAVSGEEGAIHFIGASGDFCFVVPAGTPEFGVIFYGEGRLEGVHARVFDPTGKKVWDRDRITLPAMFAADHVPKDETQVWRVRLTGATGLTCEDYYVDLRGVPPFLARDPRALLVPAPGAKH